MTLQHEITWEEAGSPDFGPRAAWRAALMSVMTSAYEKLPECRSRIDAAAKVVLAGDVELSPDGTARVGSQAEGATFYRVAEGVCGCKDYPKAPHNFCKHRLAVALTRRANELVAANGNHPPVSDNTTTLSANNTHPVIPDSAPDLFTGDPLELLPEAPVSITLKGFKKNQEVMVTLRGLHFASVRADVEAAIEWLDAPPPRTAANDDMCPTHNVPYKPQSKNGQTWSSHKLPDGKWCRKPDQAAPQ